MNRRTTINTYFVRSIIVCLLMWPIGLVALAFSILAEVSKYDDPRRAEAYALRAANWGMLAIFIWLAVVPVGIMIYVLLLRN